MNSVFHLNKVIPIPMAGTKFKPASVWDSQTKIEKNNTIIISPSGSGKTSLFSFLNGYRMNYTGEILYDNKNLTVLGFKEWTKLRQKTFSVIFQDLRLINHLSIKENLLIKNRLTDFNTESEIKQKIALVGLEEKWNQTCGTLSLGQQQRVGIIRSLLQPFEFLFADEPFSHLDDANIQIAKRLIAQETKSQNAALVLFSLGDDFSIDFKNRIEL